MPLIPQFGLVELLEILWAAGPGIVVVLLAAVGLSRLGDRPGHSHHRARHTVTRSRAR